MNNSETYCKVCRKPIGGSPRKSKEVKCPCTLKESQELDE